jgi:PKD repeat protein
VVYLKSEMKNFWHLSIAFLVFTSCNKKEFPKSVTEDPGDFYFSGTVDGSAVYFKPGVDNYYMHSSHRQESNGIYSFIADLKPTDCDGCRNSIQIKINDFEVSLPNAPVHINQSLSAKTYPLKGRPFYQVQFKSDYNQTATTYLWNFGDSTTSRQANPVHTYSTAGNYHVSLRITGVNSCQQYVKNVERMQYQAARCKINVINNSVNSISCSADVQAAVPVNYLWDFGDGARATSSNPSHTYSVPGTYPILLRVIDANNDTSYAKYNTATLTNPMPCLVNYSIESVMPIPDGLAFSNITITWTSGDGTVYSSDNMSQPVTSYFKIISVENYDNNEKNEKTKKIKAVFKCNVYNGSRVKTLDNAEAVVCVSYN